MHWDMGMTRDGDDAVPDDRLCRCANLLGYVEKCTGSVYTFDIDSMSRGSRAKKTGRINEKDLIICIWIPEA